ncbi:MAG TPA: ribonuclease H-like YkuK family protein [Candidatus Bathyarchaeia archaeon]|uniref:ribonuclease H-like YkuK family protein n=1 Tax=Brevibacillus migulae TaxID=1644114 RepID=UPI001F1F3C55|nr:ribonuclease H-like YkuK family protein [Brevibacillus migulae]HZG14392.1 ribonuclease H-like YkuK family protein [Candidatus Bathyarchaeia archaeon]
MGLSSKVLPSGEFTCFHSPTKGRLDKEALFTDLEQTVSHGTDHYEIIVGADSQNRRSVTAFAIVISLVRPGKGGTFFYHTFQERRVSSLQQRIYLEAFYALGVASELREFLQSRQVNVPIRLHFDIGRNGPTRKFISNLLHVARSNNFEAEIKPDSFCASTIADLYTK